MASLVACLGAGKGTWAEVVKLMKAESWDQVYLVTNQFGREKFSEDAEFVVVDDLQPASVLVPVIISQLHGKIKDTEVAVNLVSGNGNLHMAVIAALLKLGLGVRLMAADNDKAEEI